MDWISFVKESLQTNHPFQFSPEDRVFIPSVNVVTTWPARRKSALFLPSLLTSNPGGGVLPNMGYIGMCGPQG